MGKGAKARTIDMSNVQEGRAFNKKRQPEGDYRATVTKVEDAKKKADPSTKMWLFSIKVGTAVYPFYCGFGEKELWKIKNLFVAAGVPVPAKKQPIDPNKVVGKDIAVTLEDDEYDGKAQSSIGATFPLSELEEDGDADDSDESDDEPKKAKGKKAKDKAAKGKHSKKGKKGKVKDSELESLDVDEV